MDEQKEGLLSRQGSFEDFTAPSIPPPFHSSSRRLIWWTLANIIGSVTLTILLLLPHLARISDKNRSLKVISYYSPILNDVELPTFESQIDGSIIASNKSSIARLTPGPEANAAWHRFEDIRTVVLSETDVLKLGKDPATAARLPDDQWHFGNAAYMGQIDVVHQIHCLNQLRQKAFSGHHQPPSHEHTTETPEWQWVHLQHCVGILLENLMCNANTDMITLNWIEEADYPFPDFSVNKQCRDFEKIMEWQEERAVDKEQWLSTTKPESGITVIAGEKKWWQLFEGNGSTAFQEHRTHG